MVKSKLEAVDSSGVFRKLISVQPPQLGRVNMHYSELPPLQWVYTEFKQSVGLAPKDLTTEVYFSLIKFRSHLPVVFYVKQYFEYPKWVGEYGSNKRQGRYEQRNGHSALLWSLEADHMDCIMGMLVSGFSGFYRDIGQEIEEREKSKVRA
ncbi:PREDICTED: uncharacterized protein C5orf64 homolog [Ceratotherium simum simum]|uniref:Uncharacterized protein C5orf64 homolog n=1 Tax=Ceratotherium simum simum TaxID=73337 RepID=A0ABM1CBT7_CERSS|nr:PREDICTED: uncharacterized protein C5orf64 homolog [Ceratotherium simum simum]